MYGKRWYLLLLFTTGLNSTQMAQQPSPSTLDLEDLLYRNEEAIIPESSIGNSPESFDLCLDLNSASRDKLEYSGLFTSYQIHSILEYRKKYGPLYSIYELASIPGFHSGSHQELASSVCLTAAKPSENKHTGKHMFLLKLERSFPTPDEYGRDSLSGAKAEYLGSPLRSSMRIRSHPLKHLSLALSFDKDPGESLLYQRKPQFISAYLSYEGRQVLKHLVLGNFQLNQGLGLVNGTGFMHGPDKLQIDQRSISRIKPYASLVESMYEQGIACNLGSKQFQLLLWGSYHKFSLSSLKFTSNSAPLNWLTYQWTSGLYRNKTELEGRNLAFRAHSGIQVLYRKQGFSLGMMSGTQWIGASSRGMELLKEGPHPSRRQNYSLHINWCQKKIQLCGEIASDNLYSLAFMLGARYHFNDFIQGTLLIHHYGPEYRGSLPSSFGSGNRISNEQGLAFHLHMETGKHINIKFTGELFQYPSPRYRTNIPSMSYRFDLSLYNPVNQSIQWRARLVRKSWQTSPVDPGYPIRPLQDSHINRMDGQLVYKYLDRFRWKSRLVISLLDNKQRMAPAYALVQHLTLVFSKYLSLNTQFVLFHVNDWENRIYLHEPGFYYSFYFPAFYGKGQKTTVLLTLKTIKRLTFSMKLCRMKKSKAENWETGVQLRLNL